MGYYAEILLAKYEKKISEINGLSECIIAYRRLPIENDVKNKSTIHFAYETFSAIDKQAVPECEVLKFDIKSFFSRIDHNVLKDTWSWLLDSNCLPPDHYNVFKAATRFSYILKDDFRVGNKHGRRGGFDETKLANIRKSGTYSFFPSVKDFRESIKTGKTKLHRFPFVNDEGLPVGIPQGLPISAVLANLYLYNFDLDILNNVVNKLGGYYRRYSDDIIVICEPHKADVIEKYVHEAILKSKVKISEDKTERFLFKRDDFSLKSFKINKEKKIAGVPFSYLGFEYYGDKTLIKSTNISKFYRRMIKSVKSKADRAVKSSQKDPSKPIAIYQNKLYRLYIRYPLKDNVVHKNYKRLVKNARGEYHYKTMKKSKVNNSNYLSYVHRAADIMQEESIRLQMRNHRKICSIAVKRHLDKIKTRNS